MTISSAAFEIGAIFLLAALLMYGTKSGLVPRFLRDGKTVVIVLGLTLLGFAAYRWGPEFYERLMAPPATRAAPAAPSAATQATPPRPAPARLAAKQPSKTQWKTTVIDETIPTANEPKLSRAPTHVEFARPAAPSLTAPHSEENTPEKPESRAKRAAKSVGRLLHIGRKPAKSAEQP